MFSILSNQMFWYNARVKRTLATVAMCMCGLAVFAETAHVHSFAPPDTEYETNLVAEVWDNFDRIMDIRFEFTASPLNNVQAAFGVDENHDGVLYLLQVILR